MCIKYWSLGRIVGLTISFKYWWHASGRASSGRLEQATKVNHGGRNFVTQVILKAVEKTVIWRSYLSLTSLRKWKFTLTNVMLMFIIRLARQLWTQRYRSNKFKHFKTYIYHSYWHFHLIPQKMRMVRGYVTPGHMEKNARSKSPLTWHQVSD